MSTAHRPTWNSALGSDSQGGSLRGPATVAISSRDANVTATLNYRKKGQGLPEEQKVRNFREELETKEKRLQEKKRSESAGHDDSDDDEHTKKRRIEPKKEPEFNPADKDDTDSEKDDDNSESDSEEAELLREYEKISKEREEEQKRLEQEKKKY